MRYDRTDLLTNDDFVYIVELIPVLVKVIHVAIQRLKLWSARNGKIQSLGSEESLLVEEVVGIGIRVVRQ